MEYAGGTLDSVGAHVGGMASSTGARALAGLNKQSKLLFAISLPLVGRGEGGGFAVSHLLLSPLCGLFGASPVCVHRKTLAR